MFHKPTSKQKQKESVVPKTVFITALFFVALNFLAIYLIDVLNIFGLRDFINASFQVPYFWYYWFVFPLTVVEIIQWYVLASALFVFSVAAGVSYARRNKRNLSFFGIMSGSLALMLVEDAGDVRHIIRRFTEFHTEEELNGYGYLSTFFELFYFIAIAALILTALIKFRSVYWENTQAKLFLFLGFVFYFVAIGSSWLGHAFRGAIEEFDDFYTLAGGFIAKRILVTDEASRELYYSALESVYRLEFAFMDAVYEESLELLGAASLLAAGIALLAKLKNANRIEILDVD